MDSMLDSSTEDLSTEERLILSSRKRQEPQGKEQDNSTNKGEPQVASALESSSSSGSESSSLCGDRETEREPSLIYGKSKLNNMSLDSNSQSAYNTLIIHHNNSSLLADTWIPASHEFTSVGMGTNRNSNFRASSSPTRENPGYVGQGSNNHFKYPPSFQTVNNVDVTSSALADIPRDCLDQLTVLKHLAKQVQDPPGSATESLLRSASFSKSQPDLTQSSVSSCPSSQDIVPKAKKKKHPHSGGGSGNISSPIAGRTTPPSHASSSGPSVQILEILMRENANLKAELAHAHRKISIIQKLEAELTRLQASHAALFESTERRESLERTARSKLSTEVKRLTAVNRELVCSSNSLQNLSPYAASSDLDVLKKELVKKDLTIAQLVNQNKEMMAAKERQEIELAAQRATLAEQRNHIDILDAALTNAQSNVLRLEEEVRKKQEYVEKVTQLQRALSSLQLSSEKREQSEKKLRNQLESEISDLKLQLPSSTSSSGNNHGNSLVTHSSTPSLLMNPNGHTCQHQQSGPQPPPYPGLQRSVNSNQTSIEAQTQQEIQNLQDKLKASEEKILSLDAQVAKWERFFAGGGEKPSHTANSVSSPNTPNSWSSRGGTPHFFGSGSSNGIPDDLMQTQSRATDLEWKIKDLESRLNERDAMIRVLHLQGIPTSTNGYSGLGNQNNNNSTGVSPLFSSFTSSSSSSVAAMSVPSYRESPSYLSNGKNHQVSVSLATAQSNPMNMIDPVLMYSKMGKCDSEPPSYANLPLKMRLGGSGSSLAKNSNESLQFANGMTNNALGTSGHGSLCAPSNKNNGQSGGKSIDEQLKDLDNQLLSRGGPSGLKMQSGLCCIPGFSHPGPPARKGKVSQSLLESLNQQMGNMNNQEASGGISNTGNLGNNNSSNHGGTHKKQYLPPLPLPKPSSSLNNFHHPLQLQYSSHNQSNGNQQTIRTSSGPPFISPGGTCNSSTMNPPTSTALSLSNSVDSILSDGSKSPNCNVNVFTPVTSLPKGLPPKSPEGSANPSAGMSSTSTSKCRSLERNKPATELGAGKYTAVSYDPSRCKSLDRREMKSHGKTDEKQEKKLLKSSVSSKAAFFGQLLTRRSPSPSRSKEKDKPPPDTSSQSTNVSQPKVVRFPFSAIGKTSDDHDVDTAAFLDKQGRSSQRNRVSKWTMSSSNLEAVQEQEPGGSPWIQRRSAELLDSPSSSNQDNILSETSNCRGSRNDTTTTDSKKWGKIVKTPFGLRYTFGSPKLTEVSTNKLKGVDGNQNKDRLL